MPAVYFVAYIAAFGLLTKIVLDQHPPRWVAAALFVLLLIGWFVVIGMAVKKDEGAPTRDVLSAGPREGFKLLKSWLTYMLGLAAISAAVYFLFVWPRSW